jgi:hypothetical protein
MVGNWNMPPSALMFMDKDQGKILMEMFENLRQEMKEHLTRIEAMTNKSISEALEAWKKAIPTTDVGSDGAIDKKFYIIGMNTMTGACHSHEDSVLFLAKDRAFLEGALPGYLAKCIELGADETQIQSLELLIERVRAYQTKNGSKVPDTPVVLGGD